MSEVLDNWALYQASGKRNSSSVLIVSWSLKVFLLGAWVRPKSRDNLSSGLHPLWALALMLCHEPAPDFCQVSFSFSFSFSYRGVISARLGVFCGIICLRSRADVWSSQAPNFSLISVSGWLSLVIRAYKPPRAWICGVQGRKKAHLSVRL
jgi:hypothetical protein